MMSSPVQAYRPVVVAPEEVFAQVTDADAAATLRDALLARFDPATDHERRGEALTMVALRSADSTVRSTWSSPGPGERNPPAQR